MSLTGKVAFVTGASRGIGAAIADELGHKGAIIVGTATTDQGAGKITQHFKEQSIDGYGMVLNVADPDSIAKALKDLTEKESIPDILVNNAGVQPRKDLFDHTEEDWDKTMNINVKSVFLCSKEVVPLMIKQGKGKIVNIASGSGIIGVRRGAYGASKAAVINLTASMALELAPYKINVNAVRPGITNTPMSAPVRQSREMEEGVLRCIPYGRIGEPEDIASVALFLASDDSDFMVGSIVGVDGGQYTTYCCY